MKKEFAESNDFLDFECYFKQFPKDVQEILQKIRHLIQEAAPEATEKISYQMPTFFLKGNLVHFAAYKKHIGFYPTPSGIEAFIDQIKVYKYAKGSVQFPLNQPIPYGLIIEIVNYRVKENIQIAEKKEKSSQLRR
ncbi:DUF1801 domain-containing protein [Clostridium estertheticum]|uniref:iron chaperone n=1 Tax=Clostridium estertheticum TaxID=238834 RepID=UPI001C7CBEFF|nr:DUF1801 domain-containing protein [Clostridium estertheticum]MBX4259687.1 DUF1801 domain-containing protein [Clostridium estertheticum]WLC70490.1 DUF1801 domain-containing protein [Clostridium estertheticum]